VRALVAILQSFHFPMEDSIPDQANEEHEDADDNEDTAQEVKGPSLAAQRTVGVYHIADAVNSRLLPGLLQHLENRDETDDIIRIPISLGIVEVAKHLPTATRELQINRLLTILSQALRSHSQETRDLTRETLCRIAVTLGSSYLARLLQEMREALTRGPQLHVLAYVTHALLVHITTPEHVEEFGTLDDCANDVAHVSAEVIFGESGKDVLAEGFKTKLREVRASSAKGLDSFSIVARFITPSRIGSLLTPLRAIMHETDSVKVMERVEEVLRRITNGLNSNKHLKPADLLALCNTLISQSARFLKHTPVASEHKAKTGNDVIVQMKRHNPTEVDHFPNNSYR